MLRLPRGVRCGLDEDEHVAFLCDDGGGVGENSRPVLRRVCCAFGTFGETKMFRSVSLHVFSARLERYFILESEVRGGRGDPIVGAFLVLGCGLEERRDGGKIAELADWVELVWLSDSTMLGPGSFAPQWTCAVANGCQ